MKNPKKFKLKKTLVPTAMTGAVFLSILGLLNTNASAEIDKWVYQAPNNCTLIIDKANNAAKTGKMQKPTGVCGKYVEGYYFKQGSDEYASLYGWESNEVQYSGEPYLFTFGPETALLKAFITNTKENIKGKTMHVAATKVNVYKSATSKLQKLTSIKRYDTVRVSSVSGAWAKVKVKNQTGWVARKFLVSEITKAEVKKVVTKYKTYTRIDPTLEAGKKVLAEKGENGLKYIYYKTKYKNGKQVSKQQKVWTDVVKETQDKYYIIGE